MATLVWTRTKFWVARQLDRVTDAIDLFRSQRPVLMKPIRSWLRRFIACDHYVEWVVLQSEATLRDHFLTHIKACMEKADQHMADLEPWRRLWSNLWTACLNAIVCVLVPLEAAARGTEIAKSKGKGRLFRKKTMDPRVTAAFRCTWVYAVEKQLVDQEGFANVKLSHLTPQVGLVPGHMRVDGYLMRRIWMDYHKVVVKKDSNEWHTFFHFPPKFWVTPDGSRTCSTFQTDGISISFEKERMVAKTIRNLEWVVQQPETNKPVRAPPPPRRKREAPTEAEEEAAPNPRATRLRYFESETYDDLEKSKTCGIVTIDTNRKNFFVAVYEPLGQLMLAEQQREQGGQTSDTIPFHVVIRLSKAEYKTLRRIKHSNRVSDDLLEKVMPSEASPPEWKSPPSLKGPVSREGLAAWRAWANAFAPRALEVHALHTLRRLRLESYAAQCKMWPAIQKKIYQQIDAGVRREQVRLRREGEGEAADRLVIPVCPPKPGSRAARKGDVAPRLVIAFGDGSFRHNSVGHITMPSGHKAFAELEKLGERICWMDEFRTSTCCSACGSETTEAVLLKKPAKPRTSTRKSRRPPGASKKQLRHADHHDRNRAAQLKRCAARAAARESLDQHESTRRHRRPHGLVSVSDLARIPKWFIKENPTYNAVVDANAQDANAHDAASDQPVLLHRPVVAPWGLRACASAQCRNRLWCRDVNACLNMLRRAAFWLRQRRDGPDYLRRKTDGPNDTRRTHTPTCAQKKRRQA